MANLAALMEPGVTIGEELVPVQVSQWWLEDPAPPTVMIRGIDEMDYSVAMHAGGKDIQVIIEALVGATTDIGPQVVLDTLLLGDTAVKTLLETDKTLGGTVDDSYVSRMSGVKVFNLNSKKVLGAEWVLEIVLSD